jgi:hypothetical protein
VLLRDGVEPGAEAALLDLDDTMAARAHEVMVVRLRAEAVAELRPVMGHRVDNAPLGQERKREP